MAKTQESTGILTELAKITDVIENSHPFAKTTIIFEMDIEDFEFTKKNIPQIETAEDKFRVQISKVEFIYLKKNII